MVVPFDYAAMAAVADELIQEFGMEATLTGITDPSRNRACFVAVLEYKPKDAATQLANPTDRWVLIDPLFGGVQQLPPDKEHDQLVTYLQPASVPPVVDEILPFTMPVKPLRPAGLVVLYESYVRL